MSTIQQQIEREMQTAVEARRDGNEGRARVCARRAAGWAIGAWQAARDPQTGVDLAINHLSAVAAADSFPDAIREAAGHLTLRVTTEHELPVEADPLDDAWLLIRHFLALYHTE